MNLQNVEAPLIYLAVLNMIFIFSLGPGGPDCNCPKAIIGFGPIPARIRGFLIFILALSTAKI